MDLGQQKRLVSSHRYNDNNMPVVMIPNGGTVNSEDGLYQSVVLSPTTSSAIPRSTISFNNNNGSQGSGIDDAFHCHNREEGERRLALETGQRAKRVLWLSICVCLFFMLCEVIGGVWAKSLAIITDAAHLLTDLASMLISLFSIYLASRPASQRMSFGWYRAEVVGAFISVFLIWVVTGILVYLAVDRMITAQYDIDSTIMVIIAALGVIINLIMGFLLYFGGHSHSHTHLNGTTTAVIISGQNGTTSIQTHSEDEENEHEESRLLLDHPSNNNSEKNEERKMNVNINVRAAFIHVLGDLIQSVGVLIAGLLILWKPDWEIIDPICTLMFSVIVLSTTIYIIRDALVVLLEGRPSSIDFRLVFDALERIEGVRKVHDLRIWALTMNKVAISVHLEIDPGADSQQILKTTTQMLRRQFNVHESTIQIEGYQPETQNCHQCVVPSK